MAETLTGGRREPTRRSRRTNDPEGKRRNIVEVATREFARNGLSGARIDEIAEKTSASKRMIYYYFGDKEGLYLTCLERAYRDVRVGEAELDLAHLEPVEALMALVGFTFDHHSRNEDFIRMVMIENIHNAEFIQKSTELRRLNAAAYRRVGEVIARGERAGVFRAGLKPIDLHWQISALCFFNMSNRATFLHLFDHDLSDSEIGARTRANSIAMVLRYVLLPEILLERGL